MVERTIVVSPSLEMLLSVIVTKETQAKAKIIRKVLTVTMATCDKLEPLLQKWNLWKTI